MNNPGNGEREIADLITMLNEGGIALDKVTLEVMSRYVDGKVGLRHVSLALDELRRPSGDAHHARLKRPA